LDDESSLSDSQDSAFQPMGKIGRHLKPKNNLLYLAKDSIRLYQFRGKTKYIELKLAKLQEHKQCKVRLKRKRNGSSAEQVNLLQNNIREKVSNKENNFLQGSRHTNHERMDEPSSDMDRCWDGHTSRRYVLEIDTGLSMSSLESQDGSHISLVPWSSQTTINRNSI